MKHDTIRSIICIILNSAMFLGGIVWGCYRYDNILIGLLVSVCGILSLWLILLIYDSIKSFSKKPHTPPEREKILREEQQRKQAKQEFRRTLIDEFLYGKWKMPWEH